MKEYVSKIVQMYDELLKKVAEGYIGEELTPENIVRFELRQEQGSITDKIMYCDGKKIGIFRYTWDDSNMVTIKFVPEQQPT